MASRTGDARLTSVALLALAEAMVMAGDAAGASSPALRAQEYFSRNGQHDSEWRAWHTAARAASLVGDAGAARNYGERAAAVLEAMRQQWEAESFATYLARPDVQFYRKQLDANLAF
jgi:hypothetical protein